ncbi:Cytochrome c oxidase assembly protein cox11, mitochondrial [Diatrype stigma]|uniref:Cytochrome c oxidase assembly protein cox11, mitochondrial n=1 Tax=Diatrype stigma TaxID=117547 RepID=A0AAN9UTR8_9PEZI
MNSVARTSWRTLQPGSSPSWACASCRRALGHQTGQPPPSVLRGSRRRGVSSSSAAKQQQQQAGTGTGTGAGPAAGAEAEAYAPRMERLRAYYKHKNRTTMNYALSIILGTVAFSYGSVPLYKMICQTTGWGGQPVRAPGHGGASGSGGDDVDPSTRMVPVTTAPRIRVTFNASVSDVLPWKFVPQQREVRVLPGETALAFYTATNRSDSDIIGVATYSVTPGQVAPYFSKIQCFCFEEQRLNAGETVDMPVFFYLDPDMLNDLNMRGVNEVTLNYTFFSAST